MRTTEQTGQRHTPADDRADHLRQHPAGPEGGSCSEPRRLARVRFLAPTEEGAAFPPMGASRPDVA
jgi:hypothetical protein